PLRLLTYTTLFRSGQSRPHSKEYVVREVDPAQRLGLHYPTRRSSDQSTACPGSRRPPERPGPPRSQTPTGRTREEPVQVKAITRSEEHTSELQSRFDLVCRLLLDKKKENLCDESIDRRSIGLIASGEC